MKVNANIMNSEDRVHTTVFLDGADVGLDCVEADDVEGYVTLLDRDEGGHLQFDEVKQDFLLKRVEGLVTIVRWKA